jgi:hypothetical protein
MRYRLLPLLVVGAALAHVLAAGARSSPEAVSWLHLGFRAVGRSAATVACFAAALRFSRGDYLRRGWGLLGGTLLLLLAKDLWRGPSLHGLVAPASLPAESVDVVRDVLVAAANTVGVAAAWVLARTWYRAGLSLGTSAGKQSVALGVAALVAALAVGSTLAADVGALVGGHANAVSLVISDVADVLSFVLFAPLLLTVLALRGGLLVWTWGLLAGGDLAWLLMDAAASTGALGRGTPTARLGEEVARTVAAACYVGAGLAQRWLLDEAPPAPDEGR